MHAAIRSDRVPELMNRASESLQAGDHVRALIYVRQALALRPGEAKAHRMVGQIYQLMGKDLLAQQAFRAADLLEQQPAASASAMPPQALNGPRQRATPARPPPAAALRPEQPTVPLGARRAPAPPAANDFDLEAATSIGPVDLNHAQQRAFLDMAMQVLAQMSATEQLMQERGLGSGEPFVAIREVRVQLKDKTQRARDAWRAEDQARARPAPAVPLPEARHAGIGRFTRTLGSGPGAVSEGDDVARLQQLLTSEGLHVQVTGKFDTTTFLALHKLQEKYRLTQRNGVVGGETRRLLNRLAGHAS